MHMAKLKTSLNDGSVTDFLDQIEDEGKRDYARQICAMMERLTGEEPKMWGKSIVGFGSYHYRYNSGREGDWFLTGFSPRKQSMTIYIMPGFDLFPEIMEQLGKYKTGKSCLYVKKPEDIQTEQLEKLIQVSVDYMREKYH